MDHAAMMFTEVENAFRFILLPFEAKRRGLIAKFQILRLPTVRAGHIKTHEMCRLVGRFFDLAGAFDFRRRAANGFWPYRALNTFIPQQGWRTLFFDIRFERGKLVITDHIHGFFTVVFGGSTTQTPEPHTGGKAFQREGIVTMFTSLPGRQFFQAGNIANRRLHMRLHKIFSGRIRGLKKQAVSGFMLNKIPDHPQQHLCIANTGRFNQVNRANLVVTHTVHNGDLERQRFPFAVTV
ncbi:Uncharacterised protein [Escherichia coli]|nr:Uncharacterised protein [Escherichia coli]CAD5780149.1 Uncharacterised protein [Escherichia coli]